MSRRALAQVYLDGNKSSDDGNNSSDDGNNSSYDGNKWSYHGNKWSYRGSVHAWARGLRETQLRRRRPRE